MWLSEDASRPVADPPASLLDALHRAAERARLARARVAAEPPNIPDDQLPNAQRYAHNKIKGKLADIRALPPLGWSAPWNGTVFGAMRDAYRIAQTPWCGIDLRTLRRAWDQLRTELYDGNPTWEAWVDGLWDRLEDEADDIGFEAPPASVRAAELFALADRPHSDDPLEGEVLDGDDDDLDDRLRRDPFDGIPEEFRALPRTFPQTALGNVSRLRHYAKGCCLYVSDLKLWAIFDIQTRLWEYHESDTAARIFRAIWERLPYWEAPLWGDAGPETRQAFEKWHLIHTSPAAFNEAMAAAKTYSTFVVKSDWLDTNEDTIGTPDGPLDLNTKEVVPNRPEFRITMSTRADYAPGSVCPVWDSIWERQVPDLYERKWALTAIAAAALYHGNKYKMFIMLISERNTGKSKVIETLRRLMGDYAATFNFSVFKEPGDPDKPRADLAKLHNKRLILASESARSSTETAKPISLDASMVNRMTGLDAMTFRRLHENDYEDSVPAYTPMAGMNHAPEIPGADEATHDRVVGIPFGREVPKHQRNRDLLKALDQEWDGIFTQLVDLLADEHILEEIPEAFQKKSDEIFQEMNFTAEWYETDTEPGDEEVPYPTIRTAYEKFCYTNGYEPLNERAFGRVLNDLKWEAKGAKEFPGTGKVRYRVGRKLLTTTKTVEQEFDQLLKGE